MKAILKRAFETFIKKPGLFIFNILSTLLEIIKVLLCLIYYAILVIIFIGIGICTVWPIALIIFILEKILIIPFYYVITGKSTDYYQINIPGGNHTIASFVCEKYTDILLFCDFADIIGDITTF